MTDLTDLPDLSAISAMIGKRGEETRARQAKEREQFLEALNVIAYNAIPVDYDPKQKLQVTGWIVDLNGLYVAAQQIARTIVLIRSRNQ
jgi:hypothetical protein